MRLKSACLCVATALGLAATSLTAAPAWSAAIEWKMHLVWVPARQEVKNAEMWAERVNARTGDRFQVKLFPGGALGVKDTDMLRLLPPGNVIQANMLYAGYVARDAPELGYSLPEGVLSSSDDIVKMLPELEKIYERVYGASGIKYLATFVSPDKSISIYCKQPVNTLEELRKLKLRVWGKTLVDTFSKLGVSATIIPQNDLYVAMQTGVVDCATYYPGAANTLSLQEVAPNWAFLAHYAVPIQLIVSQKAWDALPAEIQAILKEEADKLEKELIEGFLAGNYEKAEGERFDAAGGKMLEPFPEADQKAMNMSAKEIWKATSEAQGGQILENYKALSAALGK